MATPWGDIITGVGVGANLLANRSATKSQKELNRAQRRIMDQQAATYSAAQPQYLSALQQMAAQVGPQADRGMYGRGGQFGSLGTQAKFQAGQEQAERYAKLRGNNLMAQMQQRGIPTGSAGSALAGNERALQSNLLGFRRQLTMEEEQDQQRKLAQLMSAIGMGFGQGGAAAGGYGQQAAGYGQQAAQAQAGIGQLVANWQQQRAMEDYMRRYGAGGGGFDGRSGNYGGGFGGLGAP